MVVGRAVDLRARGKLKPGVWEKYIVYKRLNPKDKLQFLDEEIIND